MVAACLWTATLVVAIVLSAVGGGGRSDSSSGDFGDAFGGGIAELSGPASGYDPSPAPTASSSQADPAPQLPLAPRYANFCKRVRVGKTVELPLEPTVACA